MTRYQDNSIEVEDFGRGCPVDFNKNENRYNWELVYCELYAGGKYNSNDDNYAYSLGLNGLGLCATQFASSYMDVEIIRDGFQYNLHFEKGVNVGGLQKKPTKKKQTGTRTHWLPDLDVLQRSKYQMIISVTLCGGRQLSTRICCSSTEKKKLTALLPNGSISTKMVLQTMCGKSPEKTH